MWVSGHGCVQGNEAADGADKGALDKKPTDNQKPLTAIYIWQKEWDETVFVFNLLNEIFSKALGQIVILL